MLQRTLPWLILLLLMPLSGVLGQSLRIETKRDSDSPVTVSAYCTESFLYFKVQLEPGWHTYAPESKEGMPCKLTFNGKDLKGSDVLLGKQARRTSKGELFGTFLFRSAIPAGTNAKNLSAQFFYQACEQNACLPPATIRFSGQLTSMDDTSLLRKLGFEQASAVTQRERPSVEKAYRPQRIFLKSKGYINDEFIYRQLESVGHKLLDEGKCQTGEELARQLNDSDGSVELELAKVTQSGKSKLKNALDASVLIGFLYDCGKCDKKHVGTASGVILSSDGLVLTNHHVFEQNKSFVFFVVTQTGDVLPVEKIVAANENADVALIKVDAQGLTPAPIAKAMPETMDEIFTVGHPERNYFYVSDGHVARHVARNERGVMTRWMQITGNFSLGSSGGPVFNEAGEVIGLMTRQRPKIDPDGHARITFHECVPWNVIDEFVSGKLAAPNSMASFKKRLESADAAGLSRLYSQVASASSRIDSQWSRMRAQARTNKRIDLAKESSKRQKEQLAEARKMLLLADWKDDEISFRAANWLVTRGGDKQLVRQASAILQDRHLNHSSLVGALSSISRGALNRAKSELLLAAKNDSSDVETKGIASYLYVGAVRSTQKVYRTRIKNEAILKSLGDEAELIQSIVELDGESVEGMLAEIANEYGEVRFRNATLGKLVEQDLKMLQWHKNLAVGKVAPDIEGPDLDGQSFKLSDYRGKVVLLDFWGDW